MALTESPTQSTIFLRQSGDPKFLAPVVEFLIFADVDPPAVVDAAVEFAIVHTFSHTLGVPLSKV